MPETLEIKDKDKDKDIDTREEIAELLERGDLDGAVENIKALLRQIPDDSEMLNALGSVYAQKGDYAGAETAFNEALEKSPEYFDACYNLGLVHSRQNRKTEAIEDFLRVLKINPDDSAANNDLGVLYHQQGKSHLAKGHFIKALEANPRHKSALLNLFEICWDKDAYTEGLAWIEKFLAATSDGDSSVEAAGGDDSSVADDKSVYVGVIDRPEHRYAEIKSEKPSAGKLTIKNKSATGGSELFLKHVLPELREKKTGLNIAVIADFNIAGQLSLLFKMINRYTVHKARMIVLQGDYLSYDKDLILSENRPGDLDEVKNILKEADFFHFGRFPKEYGDLDWNKYLRPDNTIIQYCVSVQRSNADQIYEWHRKNNITGLSAWDYTMLEKSPFFYHVNIMCDFSRVKPCSPPDDIIRICHPSTNREIKKTNLFISVMESLKKKYPVELKLIEGVSNDESLDIKSRCHMTFDQISVGIYGLSAIESMAAGHAVLGGISNFASGYHPDNPMVYVTEQNLKDRIEYLLKNKSEIAKIGNAGKVWVRTHHDPMKIMRQYLWLYDFVVNGHNFVDDPNKYLIL